MNGAKIINKLKTEFTVSFEKNEFLLSQSDGAVIFQFDTEIDELQENLLNECEHHLQSIEDMDEHYYDGCDADYLQNEWKELVKKIKKICE